MYVVMRLSRNATTPEPAASVIAQGFRESADAETTLASWIARYVPPARYDATSASWSYEDDAGHLHVFFVDASFPNSERAAEGRDEKASRARLRPELSDYVAGEL